VLWSGIRVDIKEEEERVRRRLIALHEVAARVPPYWQERPLGHVLVTLQDRADQVNRFAGCCESILSMVNEELFPLDPAPDGLYKLLLKFRSREKIHKLVQAQLVAGAMVALACVRIHHPHIDLNAIGGGLPEPPGGGRVDMEPHYEAARRPAKKIIRQAEIETYEVLYRRLTNW